MLPSGTERGGHPRDADGAPRISDMLPGAFDTQHTMKFGPDAQAIRLAWLRRRFDVSPDLAIMLATLALGEARS
jgi:hypothetical protein